MFIWHIKHNFAHLQQLYCKFPVNKKEGIGKREKGGEGDNEDRSEDIEQHAEGEK